MYVALTSTPQPVVGETRSGPLSQDTVSFLRLQSILKLIICVAEIIGNAVKVGSKVTTVKVGDRVGVGAQISACLECDTCREDNETYCKQQMGKCDLHQFESLH